MATESTPSSAAGAKRGRSRPRRGAAAPGTQPADTAGGELERRVGRLEFAEGALSRLRVKVPAEEANSGRDVLTDIDVLTVDVDMRLRVTRSSSECKSARGQSGEPGTLIWLAGFRQLLNLTRVAFVRPTISSRGRALARRLQIAVLDEQTLALRERAVTWVPERFAHIDGAECSAAEARTDTQLKGLPEIDAGVVSFLRYEALLADSHQLLAGVAALGANVSRQGVLPEPCAAVLAGHALMALVLAAIQDAARLDNMSDRELRGRLERALTTGDPDDTNLAQLLERADALVAHVVERIHRRYTDAGAQRQSGSVPSLREVVAAPPDYLDDYLDFVARIRSNPTVARDLPQTTEIAAFEANLRGPAWSSDAFAHLLTPEHAGLLAAAIHCLGRISGAAVAAALAPLAGPALVRSGSVVPDRRGAPQPAPSTPRPAEQPEAVGHAEAASGNPGDDSADEPEDVDGQPRLL